VSVLFVLLITLAVGYLVYRIIAAFAVRNRKDWAASASSATSF
jgi:hypothetical protein